MCVAAAAGCRCPPSPPAPAQPRATPAARPFPVGLSPADLQARVAWRAKVLASGTFDEATRASIERGRATFLHEFTPAEGLGPYFNNTACVHCHTIPRPLGRGAMSEKAHAIGGGKEDAFGLQPRHVLDGYPPFAMPAGWVRLGDRVPPPLAGLGWLEAVPAEQIFAQRHVERPEPPPKEVQGWALPKRGFGAGSARFAHKMVVATIDEFVAGAFFMELGLTVSQSTLDRDADQVPDPEMPVERLVDVANFIAFSSPPGQPLPAADAHGLEVFTATGCADCHLSRFTVEGVPVPQPYTDLLAHDLGPALAETQRDEGTPAGHFRTTPLWGLREHPGPFLHDGSAPTLEDALERHAGEASAARERFRALSAADRAALLLMLRHL